MAGGLLFVGALLYFVFCYAWRFTEAAGASFAAIPIDILLFTIFAAHHSLFARTGLKSAVLRLARPELERSIYVWIASLLFIGVCAAWRPVPGLLWHLEGAAAWGFRTAQFIAMLFAVASAKRLDVLSLAGLRQTLRPDAPAPTALDDRGPYRLVRHPIYLGWFVLVWSAPLMNGTRAVFAAVSCVYLVLAIPFEERDLRRTFGHAYADYARRVRWRVLPGVY